MPPHEEEHVFEDWYQAIGYSSKMVMNTATCCRFCRNDPYPDGYMKDYCYCPEISVNNRDESDYLSWIVCVMAVYKNPGAIGRAKIILHIWEGDVTKTSTLRADVDALVEPLKYSHGMYPTSPHHTIILEPDGFEFCDHEILSRVSRNFEITGGGYRGLESSVMNYIKRGIILLGEHCDRSLRAVQTAQETITSKVDPICPHSGKKKKKNGGVRRN